MRAGELLATVGCRSGRPSAEKAGGFTARRRSSGESPAGAPLGGGLRAGARGATAQGRSSGLSLAGVGAQRPAKGQRATSEAPVATRPSKQEPDQAVDPIQLCYQSRGGSGE